MRKIAIVGLVAVILAGAAVCKAQEAPQLPAPEKQHAWLQQLVGEWESEAEMIMEPGKPPMKVKGTESTRMIGGFWVVAENKSMMLGAPFTGLMTLGYDSDKGKYVGTWIDSVSGYLWKYEGAVAGKVLTLEAEGPCPMAPGKLSRFKEVLEIKSKDHKLFTSSIQGEDGKWNTMMTINYRRKK